MDDLPRGIKTNKGLNKKDAAIFPPSSASSFSSLYHSIHLSIQCYLWKVFHASLKTSTSFLSFHPSLLPYWCPCVFPERSAMCNGSCFTISWNFVPVKESLCYQPSYHHWTKRNLFHQNSFSVHSQKSVCFTCGFHIFYLCPITYVSFKMSRVINNLKKLTFIAYCSPTVELLFLLNF